MPRKPDVREFPQREGHVTNLPGWVQNTSDAGAISEFMESGVQLTGEEKTYLEQRMVMSALVESRKESVQQEIGAGGAGKTRPAVMREGDKVWVDVHQNATQTTNNGCWSVAMEAMLQSRGVEMTQQEIRAYRPFSREEAQNLDPQVSLELNTDHMMSPMDRADLFVESVPNVMVREQTFESYSFGDKNEKRPFTKEQYLQDVSEYVKAQIRDSIEGQHTPVALMSGSHFRTITGIEGDTVFYKEPNGNPNDPDREYSMTIQQLLAPGLTMDAARGVTLVRLQDLWLSPDGKSLECPPGHSFQLDGDGNVSVNETDVQQKFDLGHDPRRIKGVESVNHIPVGNRGAAMTESVYIPKQVNMEAIRRLIPVRKPVSMNGQTMRPAPEGETAVAQPVRGTASEREAALREAQSMRENYNSLKNEQERLDFFVACWATAAAGGMTKEMGQEHDRLFREYISPRNPDGSLNEKLAQERMLGIYSARHEAHLQAERVRQQVMQTTGETVPVRPAGAYAGYVEEVRLARFMDQVAGAAEKGAYRNISLSELEKKVAGLMAEAETPGAQPAKHTRTAVRGRQNSSQMDPPSMGGMIQKH